MRYSYGRSIGGGLRDDTSAGQRHVRIDLKGDGDQRQYKNDDESSHGRVCGGRIRRNRSRKWAKNGSFTNAACSPAGLGGYSAILACSMREIGDRLANFPGRL
jgi:hypothetical protein